MTDSFRQISVYFKLVSLLIIEWDKLGLYDINRMCEFFYTRLLRELYGYKVTNANTNQANTKGIDLIDTENKLMVQVSSDCSKNKIQKSIAKSQNYIGYHFIFISIAKPAKQQRKMIYNNEQTRWRN